MAEEVFPGQKFSGRKFSLNKFPDKSFPRRKFSGRKFSLNKFPHKNFSFQKLFRHGSFAETRSLMKKFFQRAIEVFLNVVRYVPIVLLFVFIGFIVVTFLPPFVLLAVWCGIQMFHFVVAAL